MELTTEQQQAIDRIMHTRRHDEMYQYVAHLIDAMQSRLDVTEKAKSERIYSKLEELSLAYKEGVEEGRDSATSEALRVAAEVCESVVTMAVTDPDFSTNEIAEDVCKRKILALAPTSVKLSAERRELEVRKQEAMARLDERKWMVENLQLQYTIPETIVAQVAYRFAKANESASELTAAIAAIDKRIEEGRK